MQIPIFFGVGKTLSRGDVNFKNNNIAGKIGARYYLSASLSMYAEASIHYTFANNFSYTSSSGIVEVADVKPVLPQLSIGFAYCYQQ